MSTQQVFQTNSSSRWTRFKWSGRLVLLFLGLGILIVIITLSRVYTPNLPSLISTTEKEALFDTSSSWLFNKSKIGRQYGGFRKYINEKKPYEGGAYPIPHRLRKKNGIEVQADSSFYSFRKFSAGVRAGFYVNWDPRAYASLEQNIARMNMVLPEWFFINPATDTLFTNIDQKALSIMSKAGVKIVPMLTNNFNQIFRGDVVHRILTVPGKRDRIIDDIIRTLEKYKLDGINIDFEELQESKNEPLVQFQKALYEKLHAKGFLVTMDVVPFNLDYNFEELSRYNDYVIVMAYDQSSEGSQPGPICHQKWIEGAIDDAAKKIPYNKIILAAAAFGYDWKTTDEGKTISAKPISYADALTLALSFDGKIDFDNDSYNLHFSYDDDGGITHQVHFTDAATTFNTMRFASEYGLSGVALWRLGSEDSRLWDFYDHDLRKDSVRNMDLAGILGNVKTFSLDETPAYSGEGEVLDVIGGPTSGHITPEMDSSEMLVSEESYDSLPSKWVAKKYGTTDKSKLVLTFDDGPDPVWTPKILNILAREKVPAAFFLVGINAENNIPLVKRIFNEGHEIGNHTFTHPNMAKVSRKRAFLEMDATRLLIECITGHSTIMFRAPFNADFEPQKAEELIPVALARERNYLDIGESLDPLDWEPGTSADSIVARVIDRKNFMNKENLSGNIILLHDAGGDSRAATVEALPQIIHYFKGRGYTFTTVADLISKKKDDLMPPVPKGSGYYLLQLNYYLALSAYFGSHLMSSIFILFMILSIARLLFLAWLAARQHRLEKEWNLGPFWSHDPSSAPRVAIVVPAFNEEVNAVTSVTNLLRTDYPNFEILFVDDGSKDATFDKVSAAFAEHPRVRVLSKPNGGKASALNYGISQTTADFLVCIDADTKLLPDAVSKLMMHFAPGERPGGKSVGAVAGNVKVGNTVNMLTRWQSIEYISSQNFDRKAFAYVNAITVVPGAIGGFRKSAVVEAGGFTTDTLAEDCDLTVRLLRKGYLVENESGSIALTESPETLRQFIKQRFRWNFGIMQTFWKNKETLFNNRFGALGWIAMPNILIFQYIIPSVIPFADFFMLVGIISGNAPKILGYYVVFMIVDLLVAVLAFSFEKEKPAKLLWLIPQRLIWRWLTWYVLFKSFRKAVKGELQNWGVLKRTGNVREIPASKLAEPI